MGFLKTKLHDNVPTDPFLRATTEGLDLDGTRTADKLIVTVTEAHDVRKLFEGGTLVKTCTGCEGCKACDSPKARAYLRLTLDVDDTTYLMDLPPKATARLVQLDVYLATKDRALNEVPLRLTTIAKSAKGMDWAEAVFAVADDGESSTEAKETTPF